MHTASSSTLYNYSFHNIYGYDAIEDNLGNKIWVTTEPTIPTKSDQDRDWG